MIKSILKELPLTLLLCLGYTRLVVLTLAPVHAQENCMDSNFTPIVKTTVTPSARMVSVKIEVTDVDLVIPRKINASKMRLIGAYLSGAVEQSMPPYVKLTDEGGMVVVHISGAQGIRAKKVGSVIEVLGSI